jgi:hypothetical protein
VGPAQLQQLAANEPVSVLGLLDGTGADDPVIHTAEGHGCVGLDGRDDRVINGL